VHELAITEAVVSGVCEHVGAAKVLRVTLEIGRLAGVVPDALRFSFELCARGTVVEGADLEIIELDAAGLCRQCNTEVALADSFIGTCHSCGSLDLQVVRGQELRIKSVEVV
jgi:hydrogenase nickel incorporation protein HypA/HybF